MTQRRDNPKHHQFLNQRALVAGGLSCLSGLGVLSTGMVMAQTSESAELAVPSAQDLLISTPQEAPAAPGFTPAPEPSAVVPPLVQPAAPETTAPVLMRPVPTADRTEPAVSGLSAPNLSTPSPSANATIPHSGSPEESYIDPTPYSLGATVSPSSVVVSERSTGCQTIMLPGQRVPSSVCPPTPVATAGNSASSVSLGSFNLSVVGLGSGRTTPSGRDYYNLTARPPARISNGNVSLMFPLSIPAAITSAFGWRVHPVTGESRFHSGTDLGAAQGTPVLAAFSGKVAIADFMGGYGMAVVLRHNKDTQETLYGHLSEIFVKPGETVKQGEVIGRVGSTGMSTGPHLHFEFRQLAADGWMTLDPGLALQYSLTQFIADLQGGGAKKPGVKSTDDLLAQLKKVLETAQAKTPDKGQLKAQVGQ